MSIDELTFSNNNDFILLFEEKLKDFTGAPYVVLVDSCSNSIFLSLVYLKSKGKLGSVIEVPQFTYVSVAQAVLNAGLECRTHLDEWEGHYKLGGSNIYDAAVGLKKDMYLENSFMCLSFQQRKAIKIGKGGAILCPDKESYLALKRMTHDGRDSSLPERMDRPTHGFHMNMTPEDAAKGVLMLNMLSSQDLKNSYLSYKGYPDIREILSYIF